MASVAMCPALKDVDFTVSKAPGGLSAMRLRQFSNGISGDNEKFTDPKDQQPRFFAWCLVGPLPCPPPPLLTPGSFEVEHESDLWPTPLCC